MEYVYLNAIKVIFKYQSNVFHVKIHLTLSITHIYAMLAHQKLFHVTKTIFRL